MFPGSVLSRSNSDRESCCGVSRVKEEGKWLDDTLGRDVEVPVSSWRRSCNLDVNDSGSRVRELL